MSANQNRRRGRPKDLKIVERKEGSVMDPIDENPSTLWILSPESQLARSRLRERWELASVLNFLHVFQPVIQSKLKISAEEIETALITPNDALAQLHIALLKGIPPVSKNLTSSDAWVTLLCKKLAMWWPWVAEGEIPLVVDRGTEILRYKELDPTIRLLILKALCEIRAEQDDTLRYINETLKQGAELSTFCKDRIGRGENGISYWYDGDSVIGHRLYKETNKVEYKQRLKGSARLSQATISFQWETIATNLQEFLGILDRFSSSKIAVEATVAEIINNKIIPVLEKVQKKKERVLKQQQRQAMLLEGFRNALRNESGRSRRDRKPVSYTFDEYDRSIDEAIQMAKKAKTTDEQNDEGRRGEYVTGGEDFASDGTHHDVDNGSKYGGGGSDDDDDDDYVDASAAYSSHGDGGSESGNSDKENDDCGDQMHSKHTYKQKDSRHMGVLGLRPSRTASNNVNQQQEALDAATKNHADTKKRLRQRPTQNTNYDIIISDSEDGDSSEYMDADYLNDINKKVLSTEKESTAAANGSHIDREE